MKKAFTLVELLICVAIISLVAGLTVPAVINAQQKSKDNAAAATVTGLNQAMQRAKLDGDTDPSLFGNDSSAAIAHLIDAGYYVAK